MSETTRTTGTTKTLGILSLVFGIIALLLSWIFPIVWILLAIAGVVVGFLSRRREPAAAKIALAGIIVSVIAIVANIASMIAGAMLAAQYLNG